MKELVIKLPPATLVFSEKLVHDPQACAQQIEQFIREREKHWREIIEASLIGARKEVPQH